MPFYENVLIARQDVSAAQVETIAEAIEAIVAEDGGRVTRKEYWGLRSLAYRIKKNRKGHYLLMNVEASAGAVQEVDRQMRLNEDVLRLLTIRTEGPEEEPSAMTRNRGGRDGGRRRDGRPWRDDRGGRGGRGDGPPRDAKSESEAKTDAKPASEAKTDAKPASEAKTDAKPESKAGSDAKPASKAGSDAKPASKPASEAKPESKAGSDAKPESDSPAASEGEET